MLYMAGDIPNHNPTHDKHILSSAACLSVVQVTAYTIHSTPTHLTQSVLITPSKVTQDSINHLWLNQLSVVIYIIQLPIDWISGLANESGHRLTQSNGSQVPYMLEYLHDLNSGIILYTIIMS